MYSISVKGVAMLFDIRPSPYGSGLAAEVHGLDLTQPIDDSTSELLYANWVKHKVLVFVNQQISDRQQIDFTKRFGPLEEFPLKAVRAATHNEIFRVSNVDMQGNRLPIDDNTVRYLHVTQKWHIDSSYREIPSKGSVY